MNTQPVRYHRMPNAVRTVFWVAVVALIVVGIIFLAARAANAQSVGADLQPQWCGTPQAEPTCPTTTTAKSTTTTAKPPPSSTPSTLGTVPGTVTPTTAAPTTTTTRCVLDDAWQSPCSYATSTTAAPPTTAPCPPDTPVRLEDGSCVTTDYGAPSEPTTQGGQVVNAPPGGPTQTAQLYLPPTGPGPTTFPVLPVAAVLALVVGAVLVLFTRRRAVDVD